MIDIILKYCSLHITTNHKRRTKHECFYCSCCLFPFFCFFKSAHLKFGPWEIWRKRLDGVFAHTQLLMGQQWKNDTMHLTADESRHSMQFLFSKLKMDRTLLRFARKLDRNIYEDLWQSFRIHKQILNCKLATLENCKKKNNNKSLFNDSLVIFFWKPSFRLWYL